MKRSVTVEIHSFNLKFLNSKGCYCGDARKLDICFAPNSCREKLSIDHHISFKAIPLFCTCFALRITSIAYNIANFNGGGDFHQSPEKKGKKDSLYSPNHFNSCSDNSPDLNGIGLETRRSPFA